MQIKNINKSIYNYFLIIIPIIYSFFYKYIEIIKGPSWIMVPQDLGYVYLINAINFLNFEPIGTLIHPGLSVVYIASFVIGIMALTGFKGDSLLLESALSNPELYFSSYSNILY